jgi:ATP-binding protein involved in chromosome partitioning
MALTKEQIVDRLRTVNDPELHRDLVSLEMIKNVAVCDGVVSITVELTTPACPLKDKIQSDVVEAVQQLGDEVKQVNVEFTARPQPQEQASPQDQARQANPLPGVKHIIAVGAGKGGVGKSTVSVNLAVGLARSGATVGLLDGDIYGPSAPTLLGLHDKQPAGTNDTLFPFEVHGIRTMTIGKLVDPEKPLIWRGPMAHSAFSQLAKQTDWGDLDYLVIDLPPGTGDVPLTLAQLLPLSGAIIVCTPQRVAQDDARRAVRMFEQLDIPVLGLVENMSYFIGDDGKEYDIFGKGGASQMAMEMGVPVLGEIPIHMELRANSDAGNPTANFDGNEQLKAELERFTAAVAKEVESRAAEQPTLSIA